MEKIKKYLTLLFLLFVAALNFNLILKPLNLATGGTQGLAVILSHILNLSPSFIILVINLTMLFLSFIFLSKKTTIGTILATISYPIFVKLTSSLAIFNYNNYEIVFVLLSGVICGLTCGYIYKIGFSQGGINVLSLILKQKFKIKIALTNFIMNFIILCCGIFYFGIIKGFYSLIVIVINSYLINRILNLKK